MSHQAAGIVFKYVITRLERCTVCSSLNSTWVLQWKNAPKNSNLLSDLCSHRMWKLLLLTIQCGDNCMGYKRREKLANECKDSKEPQVTLMYILGGH